MLEDVQKIETFFSVKAHGLKAVLVLMAIIVIASSKVVIGVSFR